MNSPPRVRDVVLQPGGFFFGGGAEPVRVYTLLGSCVAITVWHPRKRIGGMCHYLLPASGKGRRFAQGHYADTALQLFMRCIEEANTRPREYEVKLFGGGTMFSVPAGRKATIAVAAHNVEAGRRLLLEQGFAIKSADVGGRHYRRVFLELWSGDVWVQRGKDLEEAKG